MRTVVVYESMYGNTHAVARHIGDAAGRRGEATVVPVDQATPEVIAGADLVIVGGPTHMHGMSWSMTRNGAITDAQQHHKADDVDPDAEGPGLRDWFHDVATVDGVAAAAFDTRFDGAPALTGRASKGISRRLHHHGFDEIAEPESFLVDKDNHLLPGEAERAGQWCDELLGRIVPT